MKEWSNKKRSCTILFGDAMKRIKEVPTGVMQMCVTSPPYWALRDYKTGYWEGGDDPDCDHIKEENPRESRGWGKLNPAKANRHSARAPMYKSKCGKCGAVRVDEQIGLEETWQEYVEKMVLLFREVRRALRDDGTLWLNLGDTYVGGGGGGSDYGEGLNSYNPQLLTNKLNKRGGIGGLAPGNLVGIPWRVAFALQDDGWCLRQDIIWRKIACLPEAVRNRCVKAHEYVFLFAKQKDYYFDHYAIREQSANAEVSKARYKSSFGGKKNQELMETGQVDTRTIGFREFDEMRNKRSVWDVTPASFKGAHFATFPKKLILPCIKAGTSAHGCCIDCGAPFERVVQTEKLRRDRPNEFVKRRNPANWKGKKGVGRYSGVAGFEHRPQSGNRSMQLQEGNTCANDVAGVSAKTVGWRPSCDCYGLPLIDDPPSKPPIKISENEWDYQIRLQRDWIPHMLAWQEEWEELKPQYDELEVMPCTVLDPFMGSGTTAEVALSKGRHAYGLELNQDYLEFIEKRVKKGERKTLFNI